MKSVMQKSLKMFSKFIFMGLMICVMTALMNVNTYSKAEAAKLKPSLKDAKTTLYVGYNTYKIKINNLAKNAKVTYESDDTDVAKVNKTGVVTAVAKGTIAISASVQQNNKTYELSMDIEVLNPSIKITDSTDYLNVSDTYLFKSEKLGLKDNVGWSVSDNSKASINSEGKLTAMSAGKVTVTAKAGNATAECIVSIGSNRLGTFSNNITCYNGNNLTIWVTISNKFSNENLTATNKNPELFDYEWGQKSDNKVAIIIKSKQNGQGKLVIGSDKTDDKLILNVKIADKPYKTTVSDVKEACQRFSSATVQIVSSKGANTTTGTGFFIAGGLIVTNNHIIKGADVVTVKTENGITFDVNCVVGYDTNSDIAILKTDLNGEYFELNQSNFTKGSEVYSFGNPLDAGITALHGYISEISYAHNNVNYIEISTPISSTSSGGPLVNNLGEVIGINTVFSSNLINKNLVIDINELQKINTNNPLALAQYNERMNGEVIEGISNIINESEVYNYNYNYYVTNNNNYNNYYLNYTYNNQGLPSGIVVRGTITKYSKGDYFKIKVNAPCTIVTQCFLDNYSDFQKTSFDLLDGNLRPVASSVDYVGSLSYKIIYQLTPGDYNVYIYTNALYEDQDISYSLKVLY